MHVYPACGLSEQHPAELTVLARCFKNDLGAELMAASFAVLAAYWLGFGRLQPALVVGATDESTAKFLAELQVWLTKYPLVCLQNHPSPVASLVSREMTRAEAWAALLNELHLTAEQVPINGAKFTSRSYTYWKTPLQMSKDSARLATGEADTN